MDKQKLNINTLKVIFWGLLFSQVMFYLIANLVVITNDYHVSATTDKIMNILAPLVIILSVLAGLLLNVFSAQKLRQLNDPNEKIRRFSSNNIIGWACIEGSVLMNIIAFLITGHHFFQISALIMILFFLVTIPTTGRVAFALNLSESDLETLK